MAAELEAKLTANIKELQAKLRQAEKELRGYGDTVKRESGKAADGFNKTQKAVANANPTLQEFSRVIQDAPFGIQGVGNNITQLVSNFGNLSKSSGGAGAALKAIGASLLGPGGVIFAVSAIVSALTVYGDEILDFIKNTSDAEKAQRAFNEAVNEGVASARGEIAVLNSLLQVARDENETKQNKQRALDRINKEYDKLLPNLTQENLNTQKVKNAVDALTQSLIVQAKIKGAQNLISKETQKLLELEQQSATDAASAWDFFTAGILSYGNMANFGFNLAAKGAKRQNEEIEKAEKRIAGLTETIQKLIKEDINISEVFIDPKKTKFKNNFKNLDDIFGIKTAAQNSLNKLTPIFDDFEVKFNKFGDIIGFALKDSVKKVTPQFTALEQRVQEFNQRASSIIQSGTVAAFSQIGQAIGESLVNGSNIFESVGASLLRVIGQVAVQLGEAAIAIGVSMIAIKASFSNPYTAIAAGVALVALGSALGAIANNALNPSSGGGASQVAGQGSSSGNRSFSGGFSSGVGGGRVVFEISGQKLIGVLNNTLDGNRRLGGNISLG